MALGKITLSPCVGIVVENSAPNVMEQWKIEIMTAVPTVILEIWELNQIDQVATNMQHKIYGSGACKQGQEGLKGRILQRTNKEKNYLFLILVF